MADRLAETLRTQRPFAGGDALFIMLERLPGAAGVLREDDVGVRTIRADLQRLAGHPDAIGGIGPAECLVDHRLGLRERALGGGPADRLVDSSPHHALDRAAVGERPGKRLARFLSRLTLTRFLARTRTFLGHGLRRRQGVGRMGPDQDRGIREPKVKAPLRRRPSG